MSDSACPWCEAEVVLETAALEQSCPDCQTTWRYEDEPVELPLAA